MWSARVAMAMTSLVGVREMEKGFEGRAIEAAGLEGEEGWWICRVESQEAETRMWCREL